MGQMENAYLNVIQQKLNGNSCHGMTNGEFREIRTLLMSVKPNDTAHKTVFPDFISDSGFIEHFGVSSGELYLNGGYKVNADEGKIIKQQKQFAESAIQKATKQNSPLIAQKTFMYERWNESLESFEDVFELHWKDHINNLHEYDGIKHTSCFMITSDDIIVVHGLSEDENQLWYGDLMSKDIPFCLSYDIRLLDFMYEYKDDIDYVIYFNQNGYTECIKISNIPYLKRFVHHYKYALAACGGIVTSHTMGIVFPESIKGDKNNG